MIGLEGEIEFMQCHHDIAMKELEEEAQEAGEALSAPVLPTASSGIPAGQEEKGEERSPSDAAPANQQERLEEVQRDDTYDAQRADDQEGPSTSIQANKSGKRKCSRRGELLVETEPLARRQQAKVDYSGAQGRQEPSKQRK
ncbi:hypothetical protein B9Z55_028787 [Caenorhabditis nigoni]|uniref:Uncharacterized protein n=1 Tax=Caenorhabditis nigoni TaxID=1611254 RepID=A0A2G5S9X8_9PELO|nr:hypothetical protein B9Z55_028787 [Caenorhabditis nigoni]